MQVKLQKPKVIKIKTTNKAVPINEETLKAEAAYWDMINAQIHDRDL